MPVPSISSAPSDERDPDQRALLATLVAAVFMVSVDARVVAPLLPTIADEFHASLATAGLLVTAYMLPYGFFQLAFGPLADRYGKIRVSAATMLLFSAGTALCGAFSSLELVILLRALTGAAAAAVFPLTLAYMGDTVPYERRQATIGMTMAGAGAAQAFSTSAGGLIATVVSWRTVFPIVGALSGVVSVALVFLVKREIRPRAALSGRPSYRAALGAKRMFALLAIVATEGFLFVGGFPFLSEPLFARFHLGALAIGLVLGLAGVGQLLCARLLPWILRRFTEQSLLLTGGLLMGGAYELCAFAPTYPVLGLGVFALGVGFNLFHSTLQTRATEIFPAGRGTAIALFAFSMFAGSGVGALVFGRAVTQLGSRPTYAAAGALLLGLPVITLALLGPGRSKA